MKTFLMSSDVQNIGFWSALLSGLLSIAWAAAFAYQSMTFPLAHLVDLETYSRSFSFLRMINLIPAILLTWPLAVMMVCVYFVAPVEKKIWLMKVLAVTIIYPMMANTITRCKLMVFDFFSCISTIQSLGHFRSLISI